MEPEPSLMDPLPILIDAPLPVEEAAAGILPVEEAAEDESASPSTTPKTEKWEIVPLQKHVPFLPCIGRGPVVIDDAMHPPSDLAE